MHQEQINIRTYRYKIRLILSLMVMIHYGVVRKNKFNRDVLTDHAREHLGVICPQCGGQHIGFAFEDAASIAEDAPDVTCRIKRIYQGKCRSSGLRGGGGFRELKKDRKSQERRRRENRWEGDGEGDERGVGGYEQMGRWEKVRGLCVA
jgi:hypothetical protein